MNVLAVEGRFTGSDLTGPNFARLAESFSARAVRAHHLARLAGALKARLSELLGGSSGSVRD